MRKRQRQTAATMMPTVAPVESLGAEPGSDRERIDIMFWGALGDHLAWDTLNLDRS